MSDAARQSITAALSSDHRAIMEMLADPAAPTATEDGEAAREDVVMAIVRHFVAEEQYLHPAIRENLQSGDSVAGDSWEKDRSCEQTLRRLEGQELTAELVAAVLADVQAHFAEHVARQEHDIFPALHAAMSAAALDDLGDEVNGAELLAPTRPRRVASSSPTVSKILSYVEGYIDHARDSYAKRGVREDDSN